MEDQKHITNGWTFEEHSGPYHFEHFSLKRAEALMAARDALYVIETINPVLADAKTVHFNQYFAVGFNAAIAFAARMEMLAQEIAETVVGIRAATDDEEASYWRVWEHYQRLMPPAISDDEANALPE